MRGSYSDPGVEPEIARHARWRAQTMAREQGRARAFRPAGTPEWRLDPRVDQHELKNILLPLP